MLDDLVRIYPVRAGARALTLLAAVADAGAQARQADVEIVHGERRLFVDAARFAALPRTAVTVDDHGTPARFEGVPLAAVLALVDVERGELLRGRALRKIVQVTGRDGYMVVLALAETEAAFGDRRIIVADRRDGQALPDAEGPWRLVVGADARLGRSVRQVTRVEVKVVP